MSHTNETLGVFLYHLYKFQICMLFHVVFMDLQMNKIRCVNYACFPKFGHTYIYIYKNNLKIMILKRGVGIDHCYKK